MREKKDKGVEGKEEESSDAAVEVAVARKRGRDLFLLLLSDLFHRPKNVNIFLFLLLFPRRLLIPPPRLFASLRHAYEVGEAEGEGWLNRRKIKTGKTASTSST